MSIALRRFKGVRPRANARLLAVEESTFAVNVKLWNGKLRPMKSARQEFITAKTPPIRSIFRYVHGSKQGWFTWTTDVDVVRAPLANDDYGRIYFTGDGKPKLTDSTMALLISRASATNALASDNTITIVGPQAGFLVGDQLDLDADAAPHQVVTITSVTPSGNNIIVGITPPLVSNFGIGLLAVNISARFPLLAYELGVPGPAVALSAAADSGPGVTTGTISGVSDIELQHYISEETGDIGPIQSGLSPAIAPHTVAENFSVTTDGQPMEFIMETAFEMPITSSNETRNMGYSLYLDPAVGADELVFTSNNQITRPAGIGPRGTTNYMDWRYVVAANGVHAPTAGTYTYRAQVNPIAGLAGDDNDGFLVRINWDIRVRYTNRIRLTLNSGHGLEAGDRITLHIARTAETPVDRELDGRTVEIIAVDGQNVTVAALAGGVYNTVGATWTQSTDSDEELVSRSYTYTYVATISGQDMEGPPAPPSAVLDVVDGQPVTLTGFINPTSPLLRDTSFSAIRIYRFQPNDTGSGSYLFLSEQALTVTTYQDTVPGTDLGEVLPTEGWELPPDTLSGLIELPEGGAVGFTEKEICFAVPYQLHAYPAAYRRTTHDRVVALGAFGSSIVACTDGTPYVFTGSDPLTMTSERLEIIQPCMSKRGTVDLGYAVVYPSPEGLMLVSTARAEIVTGDWFTADEWARLNPSSFVATRYGNRYLCFYDATSLSSGVHERGNAFDYPLKGGFVFDPRDQDFVFLDFHATEAWTNPKDDRVYIVQGANIREFDAGRLELEYRWRSREFRYPAARTMACALVDASTYPVKFTAFADGEVKWVEQVRNSYAFRIPDGEHDTWQVEVESIGEVLGVFMAESMDRLKTIMGE
jgi:hypothetical protein